MDGVNRYHIMVPLRMGNQTAAWLHLGYPIAEIYSQAEQALAWRLALLGVVLLFALGLAWWGSEMLFLHPLGSLMRVVERVQHGDLSARAASIPAVGELTGLAESFDRMAESLQQRESAQQQAQHELRESEARFRAMYDNAAVGMAMMSVDRKIVSINQVAAHMTGYTPEELYRTDPSQLSHLDDLQIGREQFMAMTSGELPGGFQMEKRFVRKSGEIFWGRVTYSIVPDKDGKPEYLVGIIEDITEQREAEAKLAGQEAEYRRTLEQRVEERTHELAEANQRLLDEIEQRKRAEEALALKAAEDAVAAERTRLARDLHDAVSQTLFSASIVAEVLPDLWEMDVEEAKRSTDELSQLTRGALAEMRTLLLELRPAALTQSRLTDLIRQLCEALVGRARLPITFTSEGERTLPPEVQVAFYRIAQESLNNVFKYARATRVNVGLILTPAGAHLEVCDNGVGFDVSAAKPTSLGLRIMRERAEAIGADLSIASNPGEGVCLSLAWTEKDDMKLSVFKS
jgi:PAS domain S-box-containing protein